MRLTILTLLLAARLAATTTAFIPNDLSTARSQAQREGKLVLVSFYADWCKPCQLMEQGTWADPSVEQFVSQNCVAVRLDYDAMQGIVYRDFFEVEKLPTTLLLDACGNELARYENVVGPARLIQWISGFDGPENRFCGDGRSVALPSSVFSTQPIFVPDASQREEYADAPARYSFVEKNYISQPVSRPEKPITISKPTEYASSPWRTTGTEPVALTTHYEVLGPPPSAAHGPSQPMLAVLPGNGLSAKSPVIARPTAPAPTAQVAWETPRETMPVQSNFSVQVLASQSEFSATEMKNQCLKLFKMPVAVVPPAASGDQLFRVVVGRFDDRLAADEFKLEVRKKFADAFVKAF